MKKKLSLKNLRVQSFITEVKPDHQAFGGNNPDPFTNQSCYDYISCAPVQCLVYSRAEQCVLHSVVQPYC